MDLNVKELKELSLPTAVLDLDVAPGGERAYAACLDGGVYEVDIESGSYARLGRHGSYASGSCLLPGGRQLVSAAYDGVLKWHDIAVRATVRSVEAHRFWSWQLAASADGRWVASASGQYRSGGYKYEPAPDPEPTVKVFDAASGEEACALSLLPPVQCVAFSRDGGHLAAGNLMGDIGVWRVPTGELVASWRTPSFTGWGIIKGHYYTGGLFDLFFTSSGEELVVAGMGSTRDPAAGNGRQLWERFAWREEPPRKSGETRKNESGQGLMEALALHPSGAWFVMAGRVHQGKWNAAFFDTAAGGLIGSVMTKSRVTGAAFSKDGSRLFFSEAKKQKKKEEGMDHEPPFGCIRVFEVEGGPGLRRF